MSAVAWGAEVDLAAEMGSVVEARPDGSRWRVELVFYRQAALLPEFVAGRYDSEPDAVGVFCDPMPTAPVLERLRLLVGLHTLEAVDVAAASAQFRHLLKDRRVTAVEHPALEQAVTYAVQRPLASAFGFERRRVECDMSPLNAASFGVWGLRRYADVVTGGGDPGAWEV